MKPLLVFMLQRFTSTLPVHFDPLSNRHRLLGHARILPDLEVQNKVKASAVKICNSVYVDLSSLAEFENVQRRENWLDNHTVLKQQSAS